MFAKLYELLVDRSVENQVGIHSRRGVFLLYQCLDESVARYPEDVRAQREFLRGQFERTSKETRTLINQAMDDIRSLLYEDEVFKGFHQSYGGIVDGSDDTLYMDFASWFVGRGIEPMLQFLETGVQPMLDYIKIYQVPESEYQYESLMYAFID